MADDAPPQFPALSEPKLQECRYVLIRTLVDDYGDYDPRYALYDLHPQPPGVDLNTALDNALVLAGEDRAYRVFVADLKVIDVVEGVAAVEAAERAKQAAEVAKAGPSK